MTTRFWIGHLSPLLSHQVAAKHRPRTEERARRQDKNFKKRGDQSTPVTEELFPDRPNHLLGIGSGPFVVSAINQPGLCPGGGAGSPWLKLMDWLKRTTSPSPKNMTAYRRSWWWQRKPN